MRNGFSAVIAVLLGCLALSGPVAAQGVDRVNLGWGRLFSNDAIGDGQDRWHTGSYAVSRIDGPQWEGRAPTTFGQVLEYRFRAETIAPSNLVSGSPTDRRYAGVLSFGVHSHATHGPLEASVGVDLVATGPMTGLGAFQKFAHRVLGQPKPGVLDDQIGNRVMPSARIEAGYVLPLGPAMARPFVELRAGYQTFARAGVDVTLGRFGRDSLMLRDETTGQRYLGVPGLDRGRMSLVAGADYTRLWTDATLPSGGAVEAIADRRRLRLGAEYQGGLVNVFYGLTYLSREFDLQPEGQMIGSVNVRIGF